MSMMNTGRIVTGPRTYLTVTEEDLWQVLDWLDTIKAYALGNTTLHVSRDTCMRSIGLKEHFNG